MGEIAKVREILRESIAAKEDFLSDDVNVAAVAEAAELIVDRYGKGGKVLVFGNGGSAADSQHLAAELVVRFEKERKSLPCVALSTDTSILTAASNDYSFDKVFRRQVEGLAGPSDVVFAISTSGNSPNVLEGAKAAREKNIPVISLTGKDGGKLAGISDVSIIVRSQKTARVQEVHGTILHILCKIIEDALA